MKRVMVNLDDEAGALLEKKAAREKRSASSYIALLVDSDLRAAGLLPPANSSEPLAEFIAKVSAAQAQQPEIIPHLETVLRRKMRADSAA